MRLMLLTSLVVAQIEGTSAIAQELPPSDSTMAAPDTAAASADTTEIILLREHPQVAFDVGERLVFDVGYSFITAGEAVMSIPAIDTLHNRPVYHVQFTVNTTPTFSFFFKVEDKYETLLDVKGIFPWKFTQRIREGGYKRDFAAEFDQVNNWAYVEDKTYPVPPYVQDVVSAFYYARTIEYQGMRVGQKTYLENFYKDTTYPLAVKFLGYQRVSVDAGTFDCVLVEPLIKEGGLFKSEGRVIIWLTNDERKLPIKVSTEVVIGSIDAELREYYGVRGPIRAKVK